MKQKVSSWVLLIFCLYLGCTSIAQEAKEERPENGDPDYHDKHEMESFQKPGVIIPGLKFSTIMELLVDMYYADTIKESLGEVCRKMGPILGPLLGDEIVRGTCAPLLASIKTGKPMETSDMCMEMWSEMIAQERQEHPYSGDVDNPGFDEKHDDGFHFDYYDQHQDMYANYMGGMSKNRTYQKYNSQPQYYDYQGPADYYPTMERHFSPQDIIMGTISMILMDMYGGEVPRDIIEPIIAETFELNPGDIEDVCNTAGRAIFDESELGRTVRDWMGDGFLRAMTFFARITPWTCSMAQETHQQQQKRTIDDGPEIPVGPILDGLFISLGGFQDKQDLCSVMVTAEEYTNDPSVLRDKASIMRNNLLEIVDTPESCMNAITLLNSMFAGFGMEGSVVALMMGFENDQALCDFVVDVFSPESALNQEIDVSRFIFQYNDYRSPDDKPMEFQPPPFDEAMKVAGRIYNADSLQSGWNTFCNVLDQTGQIYEILGPTVSDMCRNEQTAGEWVNMCRAHLEGYSSHSGEGRYEDHGSHEHGDPMMMFYDHNSPLHGVFKLLATRFGLFDPLNPYSICDTVIDVLQTPMEDLISLGKEIASMVLAKIFESDYPSTLCSIHGSAPSGHSDEKAPDPEFTDQGQAQEAGSEGGGFMEPSVEDLLQIVAMAAKVGSHAEFCELITAEKETPSDREIFLQRVASTVVDNLFLVISDARSCIAVFNVVFNMSPEMVQHITGVNSATALCRQVIIDAFNAKKSKNFKLPEIPDMSTLMEIEEEPFQTPGQILPFLSVADAIKVVGKLYNQDNPVEVLRLLCGNYGSLLSQIPEAGEQLGEFCRQVKKWDADQMRWTCYSGMVPMMFGPEHPVALRTINVPFELAKILLPVVRRPVSLDEENICLAQEAFINSDLSVQDVVDEILDGFIPILMKYGNGVCSQLDEVRKYLMPKAENSCYRDYNDQMVGWDGTPCEEFMAREMKRFQAIFSGMWRIASTVTGFRNERQMCSSMATVINSGKKGVFRAMVADIKEQVFSFIYNERQCANLLGQVQLMAAMETSPEEILQQMYYITGFRSVDALCIEAVRLFNRQEKQGKWPIRM